jgi:hypothetical protein
MLGVHAASHAVSIMKLLLLEEIEIGINL